MSWKSVCLLSLGVSALACASGNAQTRVQSYLSPDCNALCDLADGMTHMFSHTPAPAPAADQTATAAPPVAQKADGHKKFAHKTYVGRSVYVHRPDADFRLYADSKIFNLKDLQGQSVSLGLAGGRTQELAGKALAKAGVAVHDLPLDPDDAFDALSLGAVRAVAVSGWREYAMMDRIPHKYGVHRLLISTRDVARLPERRVKTAELARGPR